MFDKKAYMKKYLKEYGKRWAAENREHINELQRKRRAADPAKEKGYQATQRVRNKVKYQQDPEKHRERSRQWRKNNPDSIKAIDRRHGLKQKFSISDVQYEWLFEKQHGLCYICGQEETRLYRGVKVRLSVDHDHETGLIRGLLCSDCNIGIGMFGDSVPLLKKVIEYLTSYSNFPLDECIFYNKAA